MVSGYSTLVQFQSGTRNFMIYTIIDFIFKTFNYNFVKISYPHVIFYKQVVLNVLFKNMYVYIKISLVGVLQLDSVPCQ